jgi:hypothetical protein
LIPRGDEPFKILEKMNDDTYKMDIMRMILILLSMFMISFCFYIGGDLWMNPFKEREMMV